MHWLTDDWALPEYPSGAYVLPIKPVFDYIKIAKIIPVTIDFSTVSHKTLDDTASLRYIMADTTYPMIVTEMVNPHSLKYRMIDGRHRIHKLKSQGVSSSLFYIIPPSIVFLNIRKL